MRRLSEAWPRGDQGGVTSRGAGSGSAASVALGSGAGSGSGASSARGVAARGAGESAGGESGGSAGAAQADSTVMVGSACTLPDAVAYADGGSEPGCAAGTATGTTTIKVPPGTYTLTITNNSTGAGAVTITTPGAPGDVTIIAERPKLVSFMPAMSRELSDVVGATISVKATTFEGLGAFGRGEGIGASAVVLIEEFA